MKSNMRLVEVIPINDQNKRDVDILKACGDKEADSQAISRLRENNAQNVTDLTEGVSFIPYSDGLGLSLHTPSGIDDPHKTLGVYSQISLSDNGLVKAPQKLIIGRDASFVMVIESDCGCCGEKHVLIIEADGEKPVTHKKYSPLENSDVGHDFEIEFPGSSFDNTGEKIAGLLSDLEKLKSQTPQPSQQAPKPRKKWFGLS